MKSKFFIRLTALVLLVIMFLTSCTSKATPTGNDFKDVTYTTTIETGSKNDASSDEENSSSSEATDIKKTNSESKNSSSGTSSTDKEKYKDPTYSENWPVLKNPNGFNINSVSDIQKFSVITNRITASTFIPNVAYIENGVARDTLFDGFIFMPNNGYVYSYDYSKDNGLKQMRKSDWQSYIYDYNFCNGYNVDALDVAAGKVKDALDMPDYKVGVFLSYMKPIKSVTDFGEVNGKMLNFEQSEEDRVTALKWFVDEMINTFNARNYQNIELCGFYYYMEHARDDDVYFLNGINNYIREKGYISLWSPYYNAVGYDRGYELGFDRVALQANYFPGTTGVPNAGGIERVASAAAITEMKHYGFEMEICGTTPENISGVKEYYRQGVLKGFMYRHHTWWIGAGPSTVRALSKATDTYVQSSYKEMYLFIKGKLQVSDINLNKTTS